jgi:two-component system sensor histidine kinase/response regulator
VASNGREALELVELAPYDLVFMDVQMPELDGLQATAEIRRREAGSTRHLHVVAMTAHAMPSDRERCLAAGMDGYVSKPVQRRELLRALRVLSRTQMGAVADEDEEPLSEELPCDLGWLRRNYGGSGGNDDVRALAELFLGRAAELLAQMRIAVAADDRPALARQVHALKGITGTVGARPMFRRVPDDPALAAARLPELERDYEALRAFLARELGLELGRAETSVARGKLGLERERAEASAVSESLQASTG